jgi:hypothetical protein
MDFSVLEQKTSSELVDFFNSKAPEDHQLSKPWKQSKAKLLGHIQDLLRDLAQQAPKTRTIREASMELLCKVSYYEDKTKKPSSENVVEANHPNARSVGLPYKEIVEMIIEEFPEAQTTPACLRWYSVKARVGEFGYENYNLVQRRPRSKPSK